MRLYYLWKLRGARKRLAALNAIFGRKTIEEQMAEDPSVVAKWFIAQDDVRYWMGKLK